MPGLDLRIPLQDVSGIGLLRVRCFKTFVSIEEEIEPGKIKIPGLTHLRDIL
jgi:hypothetical protein